MDETLKTRLKVVDTAGRIHGWDGDRIAEARAKVEKEWHLSCLESVRHALGRLADTASFDEARERLIGK
jgi:hypothetical protein